MLIEAERCQKPQIIAGIDKGIGDQSRNVQQIAPVEDPDPAVVVQLFSPEGQKAKEEEGLDKVDGIGIAVADLDRVEQMVIENTAGNVGHEGIQEADQQGFDKFLMPQGQGEYIAELWQLSCLGIRVFPGNQKDDKISQREGIADIAQYDNDGVCIG